MARITEVLRHQTARLVAITLIVGLYGVARLPELPGNERSALARQFAFTSVPLPGVPGYQPSYVRNVNPSLERISAWISSVGAAVALNDLDGDGLSNDVCYVDTRINQVIVAPVPGTAPRYAPFTLSPSPLPYDPATMAPMGCLPGDLNEDGRMDMLVYYWGRIPIIFLQAANDAATSQPLSSAGYVRRELVAEHERWFTNAATLADLDGDGHTDLILGNYFADGENILDATSTDPDSMQHSMSRAYNGGKKHLMLWAGATGGAEPSVRFYEAQGALDEQTNHGWTLAIGAADLDGDLLPELYLANDFGPDHLLHNQSTPGRLNFSRLEGVKTLGMPSSKVLGHDSFKGMGVDFGDLNGDGLPDIFVSNITTQFALEESNFAFLSTGALGQIKGGVAPYVDASESLGLSRSGWGWDARLGDFDNNGVLEAMQATGFVKGNINRWPELQELAMGNDQLLANPGSWPRFQLGDDIAGHQHNPFFVRAGDGRYYDLARDIGIDDLKVSRGIATADVDGDGRLDFAVANQWDDSAFYHNTSSTPDVALGLNLLLPLQPAATFAVGSAPSAGAPQGRPAIGATATVYLPDGRRLVGQVDGGNGHSGKRSPEIHLGVGSLPPDTQLQVDLHWRDSSGQIKERTLFLTPGRHTVLLGA